MSGNGTDIHTGGDDDTFCKNDPHLYVQIFGTIIFFLAWPLVVLDTKYFPLGRPAAALVGAAFMVIFNIISQDEIYEIEGKMGNLQALFLLVGMMTMSYYFDREGLLRMVALYIFGEGKPMKAVLWRVCLLAGVMAAFITNDATALVLSPLLFKEFIRQGRPKRELLPLALGIATSANIGSSSTIFGNPQNAFISSAAGIPLIDFFTALLPAAILGLAISIGMLHLIFIRELFLQKGDEDEEEPPPEKVEMERVAQTNPSADPYLSSQIAEERDRMQDGNPRLTPSGSRHSMKVKEAQEAENEEPVNRIKPFKERTWKELIFAGWLCFIMLFVVVLLTIPPPPTVKSKFNLGLIPLGASILTMLVDSIINRKYAFDAMARVDWTVVLMFMGLFAWIGGFQNTCIPKRIFDGLAEYMNLHTFGGVILFTVFVIIGANIFSNVPLTILIIDRLPDLCGDEKCTGPLGGLILSWVATISGNTSLIGSICNLIVAEKARSTLNYQLTFLRYARFGLASALLVIYCGLPFVYFLGRYAT
ncbi:Silicon efflux transporter LSI3 [Geodia barretti]|uniref:Silicon efflux transporter LSI3 n=1 Tax=Geodia barretti TaxID=519541 RepID=A0AA35RG33_GEOBA|nr:Silicon efflux transporter LSI3 [Geodia barretti]